MLHRTSRIGAAVAAVVVLSSSAVSAQTPVEWAAPERALAAADSFAFVANGAQQFGTQVVTFARTADGYRFEEITSMEPIASQTSVVTMSPELAMLSVEQRGMAGGREMRIDVTYDAGRATGSALTPAAGATPITVDAALAAGTIDDNVLAALLPAIDWTAETDVLVPVFHSGRNTAAEMRLRVTGTQTVETASGSYDTFRVESSGDEVALVFFIEAAAPHRVMRIEFPGAPIAVVRLN